jgi:hypothetical protein
LSELKVVDVLGKTVLQSKTADAPMEFDLSPEPRGIYNLILKGEGRTESRKIMVE